MKKHTPSDNNYIHGCEHFFYFDLEQIKEAFDKTIISIDIEHKISNKELEDYYNIFEHNLWSYI